MKTIQHGRGFYPSPKGERGNPALKSKLHLHRKLHFAWVTNLVAQVIGRDR